MDESVSRRAVLRRCGAVGLTTAAVGTQTATAGRTISDWRVEMTTRDDTYGSCEYELYATPGDGGYEVTAVLGGGDVTYDPIQDQIIVTGEVNTTDVWRFENTSKPMPMMEYTCDVTITEV